MKKLITCLATGLILAGVIGIAKAECNCGQSFYAEGPPYECDCSTKPVRINYKKVECIDQESFYTEGMRYSPCVKGCETKVTPIMNTSDFHCEGYTDEEIQYLLYLKTIKNNRSSGRN